jgi:hypothetical protein
MGKTRATDCNRGEEDRAVSHSSLDMLLEPFPPETENRDRGVRSLDVSDARRPSRSLVDRCPSDADLEGIRESTPSRILEIPLDLDRLVK